MPTYRIGRVKPRAGPLSASRRPLTCERCGAEVADLWAVAEYSGLSAAALAEKWPGVTDAVQRHETACRYRDSLGRWAGAR